jgi:hypothetical protein
MTIMTVVHIYKLKLTITMKAKKEKSI